ncbi:MAG: hypothetical protein IPM38_07060 [Ignavibacteria bacterium]|nr:hypothetical protein [Ignavibacteria bacterium]
MVVTRMGTEFDTGYILSTTNGGDNWNIQFKGSLNFNVLSFPTDSVGYAGGGDGFPKLYKTTNKD